MDGSKYESGESQLMSIILQPIVCRFHTMKQGIRFSQH